MAKVSLSFRGNKKLRDALVQKAQLSEVKMIVQKNGAQLNNQTMANMASAYTKGYSTGNTIRKTNLTFTSGGLRVKQTTNTDYIQYLENGTRFMQAVPTIKPAFEKQKEQFKSDLERLV